MTIRPAGPSQMPTIPPRPHLPDLAAARRLGPAATVEARWQQLLLVWQWHHMRHEILQPGTAYPGIVSLIETAGAEPRLRQLYPFTSHYSLNFSSFTSHPWSIRVPSVEPLHDGRFRVGRPRSAEALAFAPTAVAAVALVVGRLPAGLGPAVAHEQTGR
nr:DUF6193 family natural product biosynthesis protein [Streptomyces sp. NBC_00995]